MQLLLQMKHIKYKNMESETMRNKNNLFIDYKYLKINNDYMKDVTSHINKLMQHYTKKNNDSSYYDQSHYFKSLKNIVNYSHMPSYLNKLSTTVVKSSYMSNKTVANFAALLLINYSNKIPITIDELIILSTDSNYIEQIYNLPFLEEKHRIYIIQYLCYKQQKINHLLCKQLISSIYIEKLIFTNPTYAFILSYYYFDQLAEPIKYFVLNNSSVIELATGLNNGIFKNVPIEKFILILNKNINKAVISSFLVRLTYNQYTQDVIKYFVNNLYVLMNQYLTKSLQIPVHFPPALNIDIKDLNDPVPNKFVILPKSIHHLYILLLSILPEEILYSQNFKKVTARIFNKYNFIVFFHDIYTHSENERLYIPEKYQSSFIKRFLCNIKTINDIFSPFYPYLVARLKQILSKQNFDTLLYPKIKSLFILEELK